MSYVLEDPMFRIFDSYQTDKLQMFACAEESFFFKTKPGLSKCKE